MDKAAGHAFISYVREDARHVDQLQQDLESAGISVWRDTADLWPGEDWRLKIRYAITDNALVFIACFSNRSAARIQSYQNEELLLAIDQLRLRRPDSPWLIPVRFDDCPVPALEIGSGRTLTSIQCADLFGERRVEMTGRLLMTVRRLLEEHSSKLNPTNMPLLMRQGSENTDYDTAYASVLDLIMPALWSVDTAESSEVFLAEGAHLIRNMASKVSEFYIGEFLGIFKDGVIRQLGDEVAACKREIDDANAIAESASVELTARLTAATTAGDRRAEHEVWRDREIVQSACQSRVDAASRQTDSLKLRLEACEELATQLGHAFV